MTSAYGGNGDGVLDKNDQLFQLPGLQVACVQFGQPNPKHRMLCGAHLQVWVDTSHDGNSLDGKLYDLPELGITSISLDYKQVNQKPDPYGNQNKWCGTMIQNGKRVEICDVVLQQNE